MWHLTKEIRIKRGNVAGGGEEMKKECVICGGRYNKSDLIEGCCSNQC